MMRSIEDVLNDLPTENKLQKFLRFCKNVKNLLIILYTLRKGIGDPKIPLTQRQQQKRGKRYENSW